MSIRVDPGTGLKIFNTRAAKANDKIAGKGYSIITDEALITLPPKPPEAVFNVEEQAKYQAFKEARRGAAECCREPGLRPRARRAERRGPGVRGGPPFHPLRRRGGTPVA